MEKSLRQATGLPLFFICCCSVILQFPHASANAVARAKVSLASYPSTDGQSMPVDTDVTFDCLVNGTQEGTVQLMRQMPGESASEPRLVKDHYVDQEAVGSRHAFVLSLTRSDNVAEFFCLMTLAEQPNSPITSNKLRFNVTFPPTSLEMTSEPEGRVSESVRKTFICQVGPEGSNPPAEIHWIQLGRMGASIEIDTNEVQVQQTEILTGDYKSYVAQSKLTVLSARSLNGRRFECSVSYNRNPSILRRQKMLEVIFAPSEVKLVSNPKEGVSEGGRIELNCQTSACHPPAKIRWYESNVDQPDFKEITDLANANAESSEFGGLEVHSVMMVSKTFRGNQGSRYRCVVSHQGLQQDAIKEYTLNVFYPPVLTLSHEPVDALVEGQRADLLCRIEGGNPNDDLTFLWRFLPAALRLPAPSLAEMPLVPEQQTNQLSLLNASDSDMGWYACEAAGRGGQASTLQFVEAHYTPKAMEDMEWTVEADLGVEARLTLRVRANPMWLEDKWFKLDEGRRRRSSRTRRFDQGSRHEVGRWPNLKPNRSADNATFVLNFSPVNEGDFGTFICQLTHPSGVVEFSFELIPDKEGSVNFAKQADGLLVRFRPPLKGFYSSLVVRACLRELALISANQSERLDVNETFDLPAQPVCEDHTVSEPNSGKTAVHLPNAAEAYSYQLRLLDQNNKVIQETSKMYWKPTTTTLVNQISPTVLIGVIAGTILLLAVFLICVLVIACLRCRNNRKTRGYTGANWSVNHHGVNGNAFVPPTEKSINLSSGVHYCASPAESMQRLMPGAASLCQQAGSLSGAPTTSPPSVLIPDATSLRSYQHGFDAALLRRHRDFEDVASMRSGGSGQGIVGYCGTHDGIDRSIASLNPPGSAQMFYNPNMNQSHLSLASSQGTKMTMLSNRVMAEAFEAAARAASEAMFKATSSLRLEHVDEGHPTDGKIDDSKPPESDRRGSDMCCSSWHRRQSEKRRVPVARNRVLMGTRRSSRGSMNEARDGTCGSMSSLPGPSPSEIEAISMHAANQAISNLMCAPPRNAVSPSGTATSEEANSLNYSMLGPRIQLPPYDMSNRGILYGYAMDANGQVMPQPMSLMPHSNSQHGSMSGLCNGWPNGSNQAYHQLSPSSSMAKFNCPVMPNSPALPPMGLQAKAQAQTTSTSPQTLHATPAEPKTDDESSTLDWRKPRLGEPKARHSNTDSGTDTASSFGSNAEQAVVDASKLLPNPPRRMDSLHQTPEAKQPNEEIELGTFSTNKP